MRKTLRQRTAIKPATRWIVATTSVIAIIGVVFVFINVSKTEKAYATANETFSAGSYIIDMGISPQTVANGLKPYGLIYELVENYNIPVKWIIEPTKSKDGTDFIYNGYNFSGGPFIIPAEFIDATIAGVISTWNSLGVQGVYTTASIDVPVYHTIVSYPNVMVDTLSALQSIVAAYYSEAGIPASAYELGTPASLTDCHDLWTNPHGDPSWATHSALYNFVTVQKSFVWAECHSVSMMEACRNPLNPLQGLNFLSTLGLQCYQSSGSNCPGIPQSHVKTSSAPYAYNHHSDPVMQFIGSMHDATKIGSEQWFIPYTAGQWRTNINRGVTTGNGISPSEGTILVYGPAFGDISNGWVMYEGGHDLLTGGSSIPHRVAAIRAYHNFVLLAGKMKQLDATLTTAPSVQPGGTANALATPIGGTPPFTYSWSVSAGTINSTTYQAVLFTAPNYENDTTVLIKVVVTDACNRKTILYKYFPITGGALPVELTSFSGSRVTDGVNLKWTTASEKENDFFTVERSLEGNTYTPIIKVLGKGNTHSGHSYSVTDKSSPKTAAYYRLKQTDIDGTISIYKTILIKANNATSGSLSSIGPNPFRDHFDFTVESETNQEITATLYSQQGQVIEMKTYTVEKGINSLSFYTNVSAENGIYIFKVMGKESELGTKKMSKI